jgi:hypothetical protein
MLSSSSAASLAVASLLSTVTISSSSSSPSSGDQHGQGVGHGPRLRPQRPAHGLDGEAAHAEAPCCGKGDGYFVDRYRSNADGSFTVYIATAAVTFPDGTRATTPRRDIVVPVEAVNPSTTTSTIRSITASCGSRTRVGSRRCGASSATHKVLTLL